MIVKLFKNCILNNSYREVFDCHKDFDNNTKSVFDKYLNTLSSVSLTLDTVYLKESGKLTFDIEYFITDNLLPTGNMIYNYMMISEEVGTTTQIGIDRYYFIRNIEYGNGVVIISYEIDYWHTYSNVMNFTRSKLIRTKIDSSTNGINPEWITLPEEYKGDGGLFIKPMNTNATVPKYLLFAQIQTYTSSQSGVYTDRQCYTVLITQGSSNNYLFSYAETKAAIESLSKGIQTVISSNKYYEVDNFTVIPHKDVEAKLNQPSSSFATLINTSKANTELFSLDSTYHIHKLETSENKEIILYYNSTINDYKNRQVGTISERFPLYNSGRSQDLTLIMIYNSYNLDIYLSYGEQYKKITNSYICPVPFNVINGEQISAAKLDRQLGTISSGLSLLGSIASVFSGNILGALAFANNTVGDVSTLAKLLSENSNNTNATFSTGDGLINAYFGLSLFQIDSSYNEDYVQNLIVEEGYVVSQIDTIGYNMTKLTNTEKTQYSSNPIRFEWVNIYGNFTQDVKNQLENILLKGTYIRYSENV